MVVHKVHHVFGEILKSFTSASCVFLLRTFTSSNQTLNKFSWSVEEQFICMPDYLKFVVFKRPSYLFRQAFNSVCDQGHLLKIHIIIVSCWGV